MKKLVIATTVTTILISGCANAPPNTPGAGYGKNYTPVVDTLGVDKARYDKDLGDCRQFAGIIDAEKAAMQGMIGGMLFGALLGGAIGHNNGMTNYGAVAGGGAGLGAAANRATNHQERILINCMAGRGYRTLDASVAPPRSVTANQRQPSGTVRIASSPSRASQIDFRQRSVPSGAACTDQRLQHACHTRPVWTGL